MIFSFSFFISCFIFHFQLSFGGVTLTNPRTNSQTGKVAPAGNWLVFTQSWSMDFCCYSYNPTECTSELLPVLGVHGLWPQYSGNDWPQFCNATISLGSKAYDFSGCDRHFTSNDMCSGGKHGFDCHHVIPPHLAPGYCDPHQTNSYLADHEYPKHGSCMGLKPVDYFQEIVNTLHKLPAANYNNEKLYGTPQLLVDNVGKCVDYDDIMNTYTQTLGDTDNVRLQCTGSCYLKEVMTCWENKVENGMHHKVGGHKSCGDTYDSCKKCKDKGEKIKLIAGWKRGHCKSIFC